MAEPRRILIVEDDQALGRMCAKMLERKGYRARSVTSPRDALGQLESDPVELVLADMQMPEMDGLQLLKSIKARRPGVEVVMMTGYGTVKTAVEAMKLGAAHYIQKPLDQDELMTVIDRVFERIHLERKVHRLEQELHGRYRFENIIGRGPAIQGVLEKMTAACGNRSNVLITGESGTGKELIARGIHYNTFANDAPFVPVNCGALPKDLIESELFGYKKGAFTGALTDYEGLFSAADGGTIFLDEVFEMPPELQVKLMRVLQDRKIRHLGDSKEFGINVRVIAATNRVVAEALESGEARKDLYYRLSVITIVSPPLRERPEDIPRLVDHFVQKHGKDYKTSITAVEDTAMNALMKYSWPGNVRELENLIEMLLAYGKTPVVKLADLPARIIDEIQETRRPVITDGEVYTLKEAERRLIVNALSKSHGNKSMAAQMLGISRKSLYKKLEDYGISA